MINYTKELKLNCWLVCFNTKSRFIDIRSFDFYISPILVTFIIKIFSNHQGKCLIIPKLYYMSTDDVFIGQISN